MVGPKCFRTNTFQTRNLSIRVAKSGTDILVCAFPLSNHVWFDYGRPRILCLTPTGQYFIALGWRSGLRTERPKDRHLPRVYRSCSLKGRPRILCLAPTGQYFIALGWRSGLRTERPKGGRLPRVYRSYSLKGRPRILCLAPTGQYFIALGWRSGLRTERPKGGRLPRVYRTKSLNPNGVA